MGSVFPFLSCEDFLPLSLTNFPAPGFWAPAPTPALSSLTRTSLFIYSSRKDSPPPLFGAQGTQPSLLCLYCFYCLLLSFSLFPRWGLVCPGGYADLAQGCLWKYHMLLSSPCGLRLPKCFGHWHVAAVREPSWFLCLMWSGDAMRGVGVWKGQSFTSSQWFFL
jgi:hypothetical protein